MHTERSSESGGSTASRRGFLRTAATGAAAAGVAAGAAGTATAQESDDSANQAESPTTPSEDGEANATADGNETGAAGEGGDHGGGELVLTDGLLAMGVALVLGVLSPILFALHLSMNSDKLGGGGNSGDGDLKRIDS